jgi:HSP20 family molecular chaperone IbpA
MKITSCVSQLLVLTLAAGPAVAWWGPPGGPPGYAMPGPGAMAPAVAVRLETQTTQDGYRLLVHLTGLQPGEIAVTVEGNALVVRSGHTEQVNQVEQGGYQFSHRTSHFARRLQLPPDADVQAMKRIDGEGLVEIQLPRRR